MPALIAALDDQNPAIAEKALKILRDVTPNQQLTDALISKASDPKSPLRLGALRQLEKSAEDPRIVRLLDAASTQAAAFPDPLVRAKWALLAGQRDRAVEINTLDCSRLWDCRPSSCSRCKRPPEIGIEVARPRR